MKNGDLYLIPTLLGDSEVDAVMPANTRNLIKGISHYVVEDLRTARRFLKKIDPAINIDALSFTLLNEHSVALDVPALITPLLEGKDVGLLSEAGTPCVADPGSVLVSLAHNKGIRVIPVSGPSSIVLALMASGFNGQNFTFHGYLPKDPRERASAIKNLETKAYREDQTQIFIETPYRNMQLFEAIVQSCNPNTRLCIAANITTGEEMILSQQISQWKKNPPAIHKQPAVFLLYK